MLLAVSAAFLLIITIILSIITIKDKETIKGIRDAKNEELQLYFKERWEVEEKLFQDLKEKTQKSYDLWKQTLDARLEKQNDIIEKLYRKRELLDIEVNEKEKLRSTINTDLMEYRKGKLEEIDKYIELEKEKELNKLAAELDDAKEATISRIASFNNELEEVKKDLKDFRNRREAINKEILRQKEIEEKEDFYHIQITEDDKSDIELLRNIAPRLKHPEAVNKLIWSGYYQKPLAELRKRVAIEGSGIYKITRDKTGEVYIGQAVNISDRWSNHCRTALGVGTLASSTLHKCMAEDGPENFTFEVIEKVEKEKLKEKESYYIDFYDSKNYGLNSVKGVQNGTK